MDLYNQPYNLDVGRDASSVPDLHQAQPTVSEVITFENTQTNKSLASMTFNAKLAALRAQCPFLQILPFPNSILSFLLVANTAQDINLPPNTKFILIAGDGDYWVARNGVAVIPATTGDSDREHTTGVMYKPNGILFYVEEMQNFSVIAATGVKLSVSCFIQV